MTNSKGERLRLIIEHTGYSQKKFAERAGIKPGYLNSILSGQKELSGGVLEGLSGEYGSKYNIGWLISGHGSMLMEQTEGQISTLSNARELSLEERILLLETRADKMEKILDAIFQYKADK